MGPVEAQSVSSAHTSERRSHRGCRHARDLPLRHPRLVHPAGVQPDRRLCDPPRHQPHGVPGAVGSRSDDGHPPLDGRQPPHRRRRALPGRSPRAHPVGPQPAGGRPGPSCGSGGGSSRSPRASCPTPRSCRSCGRTSTAGPGRSGSSSRASTSTRATRISRRWPRTSRCSACRRARPLRHAGPPDRREWVHRLLRRARADRSGSRGAPARPQSGQGACGARSSGCRRRWSRARDRRHARCRRSDPRPPPAVTRPSTRLRPSA